MRLHRESISIYPFQSQITKWYLSAQYDEEVNNIHNTRENSSEIYKIMEGIYGAQTCTETESEGGDDKGNL